MRYQLKVLPPVFTMMFFCVVYAISYSIDIIFISKGFAVPVEVIKPRMTLLGVAIIMYSCFRVLGFHPAYDSRYRGWLCLTPWNSNKPLPKGPVLLTWVDVIVLAIFTLLAYFNLPEMAMFPLMIFLAVSVVWFLLIIEREQVKYGALILVLVPFTVYPHKNFNLATLVLAVLYILCSIGVWRSLRGFPWNSGFWKADAIKQLRSQAARQGLLGWPFKQLNKYEFVSVSFAEALVLSLVLTWWFHVACWLGMPDIWSLYMGLVFGISFFRLMIYIGGGVYGSPLSLMGRIVTGRFVIPKHDIIFVAPIVVFLAGVSVPFLMRYLRIEKSISYDICIFMVLFLAMSLGPTLKNWRLTGAYRIATNNRARQRPPSEPDKVMEFVSAKLKS